MTNQRLAVGLSALALAMGGVACGGGGAAKSGARQAADDAARQGDDAARESRRQDDALGYSKDYVESCEDQRQQGEYNPLC